MEHKTNKAAEDVIVDDETDSEEESDTEEDMLDEQEKDT